MSDCSDALETATAWFKEEKEEDGGSTTGLLLGGNDCVDGATFASEKQIVHLPVCLETGKNTFNSTQQWFTTVGLQT